MIKVKTKTLKISILGRELKYKEFYIEFISIVICFLIGVNFFNGCASQLPPGGGENDSVPPSIESVYPKDGTINFRDDYFELTFSEYVDKRTVKDAIFISPPIEGNLEFSWTNKTLTVYFPGKLKDSITYNITIGTDVVDYNNRNRMADAFTFAFSTGNIIDSKTITGNIYSEKPNGVMIFAYKLNGDTINPGKRKADYISQAGNNGEYILSRIAKGGYRVFAVKDEYRDLLFQAEQDLIGIPFEDVFFGEEDTLIKNINFELTKIDITPPRLLSAVMTDRNHILVSLSEEINTEPVAVNNFTFFDSTLMKIVPIKYFFKGKGKEKDFFLALTDSINLQNNYVLFVSNLKDKKDNNLDYDFINVVAGDRIDSTSPNILNAKPRFGCGDVDFLNPSFSFFFDDGFDVNAISNSVYVGDTLGNKIKFKFIKVDDASFKIEVLEKLKSSSLYRIRFDLSDAADAAGNITDSIITYSFITSSGLDFTGLSGQIVNLYFSENPIVELRSVDNIEIIYLQKLKEDGTFEFKRVLPGKYNLVCYTDIDENGKYSPGFPEPFVRSEKIKYYKEIINLPARWEVTNLFFNFEE
jgi:hypothetical protein